MIVMALLQVRRVGGPGEVALIIQEVEYTYRLLAEELDHWKTNCVMTFTIGLLQFWVED